MSTTRNPRLSKPDLRKPILSVSNRGLSVAVELRHDMLRVRIERRTFPASADINDRRKRSGAPDAGPAASLSA